VQSLNRIVAILTVVADAAEPSAPARVAESTNLSLSTVSRLMRDLATEGMLDRHPSQGTYTLGRRLFALTQRAARNSSSTYGINPVLANIRDVTGETTSLHVRSQGLRVCIAVEESRHAVRRVMAPGLTMPLLGSATGELLLACAPENERPAELAALDMSAEELDELVPRLAEIRDQGWAINANSPRYGMTGIAVAVRRGDETIAAVLVSGPSSRFRTRIARSHIDFLREEADRLAAFMPHVS
jgi:DNA-binding IclR family transcriptional regulator